MEYCDRVSKSEESHTHIVHFLAELCLNFDPKWPHPHSGTPAGGSWVPPVSGGKNFTLGVTGHGGDRSELQQLESALEGTVKAGLSGVGCEDGWSHTDCLANAWAALVCVEHLR